MPQGNPAGYFPPRPGSRGTGGPARNPFSSIRDVLSGAPQSQPVGRGQTAFGGGSERDRYNALLDPTQRNLFGLIGRLSGNPTRAEYQQQRIGEARIRGIQALQSLMSQGMAPNRALMEFVNTPEGSEMLARDPDALQQAVSAITQMAPPAPDRQTIGPNQTLLENGKPVFTAPPAPTDDMTEFEFFSDIGGLTPEERSGLARAQMQAAVTGDTTQTERATSAMVKRGMISGETKLQIDAGTKRVMPIRNHTGETVGHVLVDISNGQVTQLDDASPQNPAMSAPGLDAEGNPVDPNALPEPGQALGSLERPASMIRGVGILPILEEAGKGIIGQEFPQLSGREVSAQRNALRDVVLWSQQLRDLLGGRGFAADVEKIDSVINRLGIGSNPAQAGQAMIDLHTAIQRRREIAAQAIGDRTTTNEVRANAEKEMYTLNQLEATLPTVEDIEAEITAWESEPGAFERGAAKIDEATRGMTGTQPEGDVPTFETMQEAVEAFNAGTIKFGDRVIIREHSDQPVTLTDPNQQGD